MPDDSDNEDFEKVVDFGERKRKRRRLLPFSQLNPRPNIEYLVKGIIPRVGLVVVWGPPKCGKSFWVFDLSLHVALGRPYRDHLVRQGTVVYCALEGEEGFLKRIGAAKQHFGVNEAPFYLMTEELDLTGEHIGLIKDIGQQCAKPAMVVIDTLNRSLVGSESSDEDMAKYVKAADKIRIAFACVVVIVHHCGIDATRPRGHTSLTGATDAQISVKRDAAKNVVTTVEFLKDGEFGETLLSKLEIVEVLKDEIGDPITSCVVVPIPHGGVSDRRRKVRLTDRAVIALRLLGDAIAEQGDYKTNLGGRVPVGAGHVRTEVFRDYFVRGSVAESDKPDTQSKAFRRVVAELQAAARIGIWQDHIWVTGQPDR